MKTQWIYLTLCLSLLASSCEKKKNLKQEDTLKIGAMAGPEAELVKTAIAVAKRTYQLKVSLVEFSDYVSPNSALADKSIDANAFQTLPYLNETIKARGYALTSVGKTFLYPIGIYSKKLKDLKDTPQDAKIAIANDPSNEARALLILEQAKIIKLKEGAGLLANVNDIVENPKNLKITTLDAAQLPRVLDDVDFAVINTNYAKPAGLIHGKDTIFVETTESPYMNIIVARTEDKDTLKIKQFVQAYQSPEVAAKAKELFGNTAVAGF